MFGLARDSKRFVSEDIPCIKKRYVGEARRLYGVLDHRLAEAAYLGGDCSIAGIAAFPWGCASHGKGWS